MIPISNKLALLILFLPVFTLVSVFGVGFYLYRGSLDASAFSTAVSSLLSAFFVVLLVWERLRDSLFKKLEYLHKSFLFNLFTEFGDGNLRARTTIAIIVVFALVLYFLYKFKRKLEKDEERVICKKCGSLNLPSDKFCSNCGSPLPS